MMDIFKLDCIKKPTILFFMVQDSILRLRLSHLGVISKNLLQWILLIDLGVI